MTNKPIYLSWTQGVQDWEAGLIIAGVQEMLGIARLFPGMKIFGSRAWGNPGNPFSSPEWYQQSNLIRLAGRPPQVNADGVMDCLQREPWRREKDHFDVMICDMDLNTRINGKWINFIFGEANNELGLVLSVYRFRHYARDRNSYRLLLRNVARHEFGHVLGLVRRRTTDQRGGLYQSHCQNLCVMKQSLSVDEALQVAQALVQNRVVLCSDCIAELESYRG